MQRLLTPLFFFFFCSALSAQSIQWSAFVDTVVTLSSPRAADLNNDGIQDIVIGGGRDGVFSNRGIMAFDGSSGNMMWSRPARNEIFGSALFQDVNTDGTKDVIIVGRGTQLLAVNGLDGQLLWDFFPYNTNPADSGLYNFYNPQTIRDVNGDGVNDLLVTNGGNHLAPAWDTNRPPGYVMVISAANGQTLIRAVVPDSMETYCSPVVADLRGDGAKWILYGTGGETLGGSFWACPLDSLLASHTLSASVPLLTDNQTGYIAPPSVHPNKLGGTDIIVQSFGGTISKINGNDLILMWEHVIPGTQSSAAPALGNFTGNSTPDVLAVLAKGEEPAYTDFYQLMLDGETGQPKFFDSLGTIHFASANAVDLNQDGRDEGVITVNTFENGVYRHRLYAIDFIAESTSVLGPVQSGVNLASSPLINDMDQNGSLDLVYVVKKDSINPVGWKGFSVQRMVLPSANPYSGVAWGSYMGTKADGSYSLGASDCGTGSVVSAYQVVPPSCNGQADASVLISLVQPGLNHTFSWSNNTQSQHLSNVPAGYYELVATNNQGCSETILAEVSDPYIISFGPVTPQSCPGVSDAAVMVYSTGCQCMFSTCTYLWDNGCTNKFNDSLHVGYNRVRITHPSGCVVTDSVWIEPAFEVGYSVAAADVTCYGGQNGALTLSSSGSATLTQFQWSTGDTTSAITELLPGVYEVTVKDSRGCADTLLFTVEEDIRDSVEVQALWQSVSCYGNGDGMIELVESATYPLTQILWENGDTSHVRENLPPGEYAVVLIDSRNCRDTLSWGIEEPDLLQGNLIIQDAGGQTSADGGAVIVVSGGVAPYLFNWSSGSADSSTGNVLPGSYIVEVFDQNGCRFTDTAEVGWLPTALWEESGGLLLYPNPFTNFIQVEGKAEQVFDYTLFDGGGRKIRTGVLSSRLDLADLSIGQYVLHLKSKSQSIFYRLV